jgi:deoxyribonuclease-4
MSSNVLIGPGGTAGLGYDLGLRKISELGLGALEVEFTHGVNMSNDTAKVIGKLASELGVALSCHGPYFINLASKEKIKIKASIKRILDSCERAHHMGATHVVYHSGFFQKQDPKKVFEMIKENTAYIMDKIKENKWKVKIAPELTGKASQFGSIPELLELRKETGCEMTIDFAHQMARDQGKIDYDYVFSQIKSLNHIHAHFSGIEWTAKGERRHLLTPLGNIKSLLKEVLKRKVDITIINESPDPIGDAFKMKKVLGTLI